MHVLTNSQAGLNEGLPNQYPAYMEYALALGAIWVPLGND